MQLASVPEIVYAYFVLHNFCEIQGVNIDDEVVQQQIAHDMATQPNTVADCLYSFYTAEGAQVRNIITRNVS